MSQEAIKRYHKEKTLILNIRLVKTTEEEIIKKLESVPNKSRYIKNLILADIKKEASD